MADTRPKPEGLVRSEDIFEEEIEDLERPSLRSWSLWLAALGALALLAAITVFVVRWDTASYQLPEVGGLAPMVLLEPKGSLDGPPRAFRWAAVHAARSYVVTVESEVTGETVLLRPSETTHLVPAGEEMAQVEAGGYRWTIEAKDSTGRILAHGEGRFTIAPAL